jgi:hypothetical protein
MIMAAVQIDRSRWSAIFDSLTRFLVGNEAEIEVASLDLGDQVETDWTPLIGIAYDEKSNLIEIALDELDHLIRSPREVFVDEGVSGLVAIEIVDSDGNRHIVKLKEPLALPAPKSPASATAGQ